MNVVGMLKNLIRWAVITAPSADDKDFPTHQITYMGKVADCLAWFPYGFHANPGAETLALMVAANADNENRVMFPGSPKERLDELLPTPLAEGELLVFNPLTKSHIHFKADGSIDIDSKTDLNIKVAGNMLADVEGNLTAEVEGNLVTDVEGTITETAEGDASKVITGGDDDVTADNINRVTAGKFYVEANEIIIGDGNDDVLWVISTLLGFMANTLHTGASNKATLEGYQDRIDGMRNP